MSLIIGEPGFYINLPVGGLAALILLLIQIPDVTVKEPFTLALLRKVVPQLDLIGFVMFAPATIMFILALQFGSEGDHPWNGSVVIGLFCGAVALAVVFVIWEKRVGEHAMIPGSIVGQRIVWSSAGQGAVSMSGVIIAGNYLPIYFQAIKGTSPTLSGAYLLPSVLTQLLFVVVSGAAGTTPGFSLVTTVWTANENSVETRLLSSLATLCFRDDRYRCWSHLDLFSLDRDGQVDRLSDHSGCRSRLGDANGLF